MEECECSPVHRLLGVCTTPLPKRLFQTQEPCLELYQGAFSRPRSLLEKLQLGIKNTRRFRTRLTQTGAKPAGVFVLAGFTYFFTRTPTYWGWSERESRSLALPDRDRRQVPGRAGSPAPSRLWLVKPCRSLWRTLFQSSPYL